VRVALGAPLAIEQHAAAAVALDDGSREEEEDDDCGIIAAGGGGGASWINLKRNNANMLLAVAGGGGGHELQRAGVQLRRLRIGACHADEQHPFGDIHRIGKWDDLLLPGDSDGRQLSLRLQ
jgi:hypothetical protein